MKEVPQLQFATVRATSHPLTRTQSPFSFFPQVSRCHKTRIG